MIPIFKIDGKSYNVRVTELSMSFDVLDRYAERNQNADLRRNIAGTFYNYKMVVSPAGSSPAEFAAFYKAITAPVEFHTVEMPFVNGTRTFEAYLAVGELGLVKYRTDNNHIWRDISIDIIARKPV